jgi:hypothetical protein
MKNAYSNAPNPNWSGLCSPLQLASGKLHLAVSLLEGMAKHLLQGFLGRSREKRMFVVLIGVFFSLRVSDISAQVNIPCNPSALSCSCDSNIQVRDAEGTGNYGNSQNGYVYFTK